MTEVGPPVSLARCLGVLALLPAAWSTTCSIGLARLALFEKDGDYEAFEWVVAEGLQRHPTRLLGYLVMPNHWHMVIWPDIPAVEEPKKRTLF